jgi:branched-chain amino acid aminotransferase
MPVCSVDNAQLGDGTPGPVTTRLKQMYWELHDDPAYATPVRYELAEAS